MPALLLRFLQGWNSSNLRNHYFDTEASHAAARRIGRSIDPIAALVSEAALFGNLAGHQRIASAVHARPPKPP